MSLDLAAISVESDRLIEAGDPIGETLATLLAIHRDPSVVRRIGRLDAGGQLDVVSLAAVKITVTSGGLAICEIGKLYQSGTIQEVVCWALGQYMAWSGDDVEMLVLAVMRKLNAADVDMDQIEKGVRECYRPHYWPARMSWAYVTGIGPREHLASARVWRAVQSLAGRHIQMASGSSNPGLTDPWSDRWSLIATPVEPIEIPEWAIRRARPG